MLAPLALGLVLAQAPQAFLVSGNLPFTSVTPLSASWAAPPSGDFLDGFDGQVWHASEGLVAPPPASARTADLIAWLRTHYPFLMSELTSSPALPEVAKGHAALVLAGGPPLHLYVIAGQGLVLQGD